jgi:hypothetical protein
MKPEHHRLLHDLLEGNDAASQRDAILSAGHRVLRRKRHGRYVTRTLAVVACAGLLAFAISRVTSPHPPATAVSPKLAANPPTPPSSHVQRLTDDELLALFPGTPVGLVQVDGKKRLIFPRPEDEARFIVHL